jgi:carbon storage regulator
MLVLSRKANEEIVIGENIRITVVKVAGNKVRIGVTAPKSISIRRPEVDRPADPPVELSFEESAEIVLC